ncbi:hypothetical protein Q31b_17270 [Novipirellula aureliae]|uniref:Uncharacterized protein n=1 Tax=Novipirellula aureliae TaxID=2527966 RepID=A0A5C6E8Z9_9BACT|nr:hypothetical protein Q31b_17270 [Novipirellula aureliae]
MLAGATCDSPPFAFAHESNRIIPPFGVQTITSTGPYDMGLAKHLHDGYPHRDVS